MTLQGWCAYRGGPVLVAAYQPLQTILVALLSSTFLGETFYMGRCILHIYLISVFQIASFFEGEKPPKYTSPGPLVQGEWQLRITSSLGVF